MSGEFRTFVLLI